jgi:type II secretory pathway component PulF
MVIAAIFVMRRVGVLRWLRQEVFARMWPFSSFMRRMAVSRFARSLALMSNCGITMEPALRQSALASGLRVVERDILRAIPAIRQGRPLHEALRQVRCLSPMFHEMVYVGEQSGNIGHVLRQMAQDMQEEVRHRLIILASSVEGIAIILLGVAIVMGRL